MHLNVDRSNNAPANNLGLDKQFLLLTARSRTTILEFLRKNRGNTLSVTGPYRMVAIAGRFTKLRSARATGQMRSFASDFVDAWASKWGAPPGVSHALEALITTRKKFVLVFGAFGQTEHSGRVFRHQGNTLFLFDEDGGVSKDAAGGGLRNNACQKNFGYIYGKLRHRLGDW